MSSLLPELAHSMLPRQEAGPGTASFSHRRKWSPKEVSLLCVGTHWYGVQVGAESRPWVAGSYCPLTLTYFSRVLCSLTFLLQGI